MTSFNKWFILNMAYHQIDTFCGFGNILFL